MKLPVWPKDERGIIDEDGVFVCFANSTEDRDYIVQAINSHEHENVIEDFIEQIKEKGLEQALKETENKK